MKESSFTTIKYPLRWMFQLLNISLLIYLIVSLFNKKIVFETPYDIIIITSIIIEVFSIIYLLRNKMYCYIGKDKTIYLIARKHLTTKDERKTSEGLLVDHYRYDDKLTDVSNLLDIILVSPSEKEIQKQIKDKVLTYPQYQVKKIKLNFKFLGCYCYTILFENNKRKCFIVLNNLSQEE